MTLTAPSWSDERVTPTFNRLLSLVRHRATRGIALGMLWRPGFTKGKRGTSYTFPKGEGPRPFTRAFNWAASFYDEQDPDHAPAAMAKAHVKDFLAELRRDTLEKYHAAGYWYRAQVSLLFNKRPYRRNRRELERSFRRNFERLRAENKAARKEART